MRERWEKVSIDIRSKIMSELAHVRWNKVSEEERKELAMKMVRARK